MRDKIFLTTFSFLLLTLMVSSLSAVYAGEIIIKVRAVNPLAKEAETPMTAYLPKGATPKDVISNKGGFKIEFDKEKELYYVTKKVMLKPKQVVTLEIELKDIWAVSKGKIDGCKNQLEKIYAAERLADVKKTNATRYKLAVDLRDQILKNLDRLSARQAKDTIVKIGVDKHIEEYFKDADSLKQAELDLKMLGNLLTIEKKKEKK